jgi:pimeloyl-ACP methyl ester carboxylesterase
MLLEARAPLELGASIAALPLLRTAPMGDGHPVLVLPGLVASDTSTVPLRWYIGDRGYDVRGWDLGRNLGPRPGVLEGIRWMVRRLADQTGRKVSLIGWSLGGIYAREIAKMVPNETRFVITLGTPFAGSPKSTNAWRVYEMASGERVEARADQFDLRTPPPVPTTSIYSRSDGIVSWQASVQDESPTTENIEVEASHIGLGVNPAALYAIADRLAQPEHDWQPFRRTGIRRMVYGDPKAASRPETNHPRW